MFATPTFCYGKVKDFLRKTAKPSAMAAVERAHRRPNVLKVAKATTAGSSKWYL